MTKQRIPARAACAAPMPTLDSPAHPAEPATLGHAMYGRLRAAGRRAAPPAMTGEVLAEYWRFVAASPPVQRRDILRRLRDDIAAGQATPRALLPVALGEPDLDLARAATRAYVGGWPASVERREHAVADVLDWIERSLALNRAALCCALLDTADDASLERLAPLRRRLSPHEAAVVFEAVGDEASANVAAFLQEWRTLAA